MRKLLVILTKLGILAKQLEFSYQLSVNNRAVNFQLLETENCELKTVLPGGQK
ncbi:MAG: hypothetical protein UX60_C0010G0011 [Berkelbacteria bacterium GW2011_GWA2_46_7]|uniref:Uncharacterized protein n=1 Tax=Berkelbacteria bacterium GW2011_GWA2_46_7 TaxID=1618335 RepID=A0A0G1QH57_9BACT|nr:MAG: hypothetical protein UX60_C0010G0011 [Berkelbacteria bacterium GW2011_GWA2_46_7]